MITQIRAAAAAPCGAETDTVSDSGRGQTDRRLAPRRYVTDCHLLYSRMRTATRHLSLSLSADSSHCVLMSPHTLFIKFTLIRVRCCPVVALCHAIKVLFIYLIIKNKHLNTAFSRTTNNLLLLNPFYSKCFQFIKNRNFF